MKFTILTLFPNIFDSYLNESILKRAQENKKISIEIIDIRKFTDDKHHTVDDKPYGGGPGMLMKAEPILKAFSSIKKSKDKPAVFLMSAAGKKFTNVTAKQYVKKYKNIVLIAGRYEGIDDRVKKILKAQEVSIGDYVLTGGELPAMVLIDAIARHIPGVLGKQESIEENRFGVGIPTYTRPEILKHKGKKYIVPKVLLSGDHKKINEWRNKQRVL
ncbi:MAG: tRNA (guanosine(37)-N1)-methyltransferase TrmD [Patescibacteria group bacterium]